MPGSTRRGRGCVLLLWPQHLDRQYLCPAPGLLCSFSSYGLLFQEDKGRQEHRPSFHLLSVCFLVISPVAVAKCLRRSNLQEGGAYLGSRFEVIQSPMVAGSGKAAPHIAPRAQKQREMNRSRLEW